MFGTMTSAYEQTVSWYLPGIWLNSLPKGLRTVRIFEISDIFCGLDWLGCNFGNKIRRGRLLRILQFCGSRKLDESVIRPSKFLSASGLKHYIFSL